MNRANAMLTVCQAGHQYVLIVDDDPCSVSVAEFTLGTWVAKPEIPINRVLATALLERLRIPTRATESDARD